MDLYCDFPGCGRWACQEHIGWARERADAARDEYLRQNALDPEQVDRNGALVDGRDMLDTRKCHCGARMMVTPLGGFPSCSAMYKSGYHRDKAE